MGRLITVMTIFDSKYESKYGTDNSHIAEMKDGWFNVKRNWILGVTHFGSNKTIRVQTVGQSGLFVHNGYLQIWLVYGILGLILYLILYYKALLLGFSIFYKYNEKIGFILFIFIICQIIKNFIWPGPIKYFNVTIIYIFLISLSLKIRSIHERKK